MAKKEGIYVKPWQSHRAQGVRYNEQASAVNVDNAPAASVEETLRNSQAQVDGARELADRQAEQGERPLQ